MSVRTVRRIAAEIGRSIVVYGDAAGTEAVRRGLHDWLTGMHLVPAGSAALVDRYVGYYEPYATSHEALNRDDNFVEEFVTRLAP